MKLKGKNFFSFEVLMLLCGIATACIEALNYGISLFYVIGQLFVYPLCFCIGGIAAWKAARHSSFWQLAGYSLLFSSLLYNVFHIVLYPVFGVPFCSSAHLSAMFVYILSAILPVLLCCYVYKQIEKRVV